MWPSAAVSAEADAEAERFCIRDALALTENFSQRMVVEAWTADEEFFPLLGHHLHLMVNAWHGEVVEGHVHPVSARV